MFAPQYIEGLGTYQDAGPLENDPVISAITEAKRLFPHLKQPDFVLSLGTGNQSMSITDTETNRRHSFWEHGALTRLCRILWEKMSDRKVRQLFQDNPRYHRLDVSLGDSDIRLDDVESIPDLKFKALSDESISMSIKTAASCLVASLFYFELAGEPHRLGTSYSGQGYILCTLSPSYPGISALLDRLALTKSKFFVNDISIENSFNRKFCLGADGSFRLAVEFKVEKEFSITLRQDKKNVYHISASPFSVETLELLQGLSWPFGRADHRKRKIVDMEDNPPKKRVCR